MLNTFLKYYCWSQVCKYWYIWRNIHVWFKNWIFLTCTIHEHLFPIFSSPEQKVQVSFSDHNLSVVRRHCRRRRRRRCRRRLCKLFTLSSSSPEPLGQFQPNLAQSILGWRRFKWRATGDNSENTLTIFKNLLLQNHWSNFKQTWHKASLGKGNSSLFKWRATPFPKGDIYEIAKIY